MITEDGSKLALNSIQEHDASLPSFTFRNWKQPHEFASAHVMATPVTVPRTKLDDSTRAHNDR